MPQAIAIPAITAAGALGGTLLQSGAQRSASKAQQQATSDALAFEREKYNSDRAQRAAEQAHYQQRWDAWNNTRMALLRARHPGVDFGPMGGGSGSGQPSLRLTPLTDAERAGIKTTATPFPGAQTQRPVGGASMGGAPAPGPMAGTPMGDLMAGGAPEEAPVSEDVFDWRNYGVR